MARVCLGDQSAFDLLYKRYIDKVYSLARQMLGQNRADEVVQDIFLSLWHKATQYNPNKGSFPSWFLRLAHNRIVDELRRSKKNEIAFNDDLFNPERHCDIDPDAAELIQNEIKGKAVARALACLPEAQRETLKLSYFHGLSHSQIAKQLNLPLGTVKTRIRLGLTKLKGQLENWEVMD